MAPAQYPTLSHRDGFSDLHWQLRAHACKDAQKSDDKTDDTKAQCLAETHTVSGGRGDGDDGRKQKMEIRENPICPVLLPDCKET